MYKTTKEMFLLACAVLWQTLGGSGLQPIHPMVSKEASTIIAIDTFQHVASVTGQSEVRVLVLNPNAVVSMYKKPPKGISDTQDFDLKDYNQIRCVFSSGKMVAASSIITEAHPQKRFHVVVCDTKDAVPNRDGTINVTVLDTSKGWQLGPLVASAVDSTNVTAGKRLGPDNPAMPIAPIGMCIAPTFRLKCHDPLFWQAIEHNRMLGVDRFYVYDEDVFG